MVQSTEQCLPIRQPCRQCWCQNLTKAAHAACQCERALLCAKSHTQTRDKGSVTLASITCGLMTDAAVLLCSGTDSLPSSGLHVVLSAELTESSAFCPSEPSAEEALVLQVTEMAPACRRQLHFLTVSLMQTTCHDQLHMHKPVQTMVSDAQIWAVMGGQQCNTYAS